MFGRELGNLTTVPGDARRPADGLDRGVPQLTVIDPLITARQQHDGGCPLPRQRSSHGVVRVSSIFRIEKVGSSLSRFIYLSTDHR